MATMSATNNDFSASNTSKIQISDEDFIFYDFSKSHILEEDAKGIKQKILDCEFNSKITGMIEGKNINFTENRPVLHHLLRDKAILEELEEYCKNSKENDIEQNHKKIKQEINEVLNTAKTEILSELIKIYHFSKKFEELRGITDKPFDTIVNTGIGGSDLGPRMVSEALQFYSSGKKVYFISNVDSTDTLKSLRKVNLEKTMFIVVSKTFTTIETIKNFQLVLNIFNKAFNSKFTNEEICNKHFVAVSSNVSETQKYGIRTVFKMWDFVGGRYSMWSAVGLSICLYIGFENYLRMLKGASVIDEHFFKHKENSIPVKMAINELFYISKGFNNKCIVCYDSYMELLYKYLQQAEMESNGKHNSKQMIIWGGVGTDVQHSFFQLLHQGSQDIYLEFLCPIKNINTLIPQANNENTLEKVYNIESAISECKDLLHDHQNLLFASCLAQSRSLLIGKKSDDINLHFEGDKPSTTILYSKLTPEIMGALIAVYEHKIFVEGVYFKINSFDQFGVQLGKTITNDLVKHITGEITDNENLDRSTETLIEIFRKSQ